MRSYWSELRQICEHRGPSEDLFETWGIAPREIKKQIMNSSVSSAFLQVKSTHISCRLVGEEGQYKTIWLAVEFLPYG
jgi:hypothetical protein